MTLPPLPKAIGWAGQLFQDGPKCEVYTADQMRAYAEAAVKAEREACAKLCEARYMGDNNREDMEARACAAAIRARGE